MKHFLLYLLEPALRSLAVGCLAALVLTVLPVKRAVARLYVWTGVLYVALAMPLLGSLLPSLKIAVPAIAVAQTASMRPAGPELEITQPNGQNRPRTASISTSESPSLPSRAASLPPTPTTSLRPATWKVIVCAVYLFGLAVLLARLFLAFWWTRRLVHSGKDIHDGVLNLLNTLSRCAGLARPPRCKESTALLVPVTIGTLRPVILLPACWRTWPQEQLQAILAHEISHVARRDACTQFLSLLHRAIFWFSPLAWWINRRITELAEQASDDAALAGGADRTRYAETLLGFFAQLQSVPGRVRWQALSMANRESSSRAEQRVERILEWKGVMSVKKSLIIAMIALAAPVIFLAASVHPFIAYAQHRSQTTIPPLTLISSDSNNGQASPQLHLREEDQDEKKSSDDHAQHYVIVSGNSSEVSMSGGDEDYRRARALRVRINGEFIWFDRGGKSYAITDPAFIAKAKALFAPEDDLAKKQDALSKQQDELGRQEDALGQQSEKIKVKVPDITPELERIHDHLKELASGGATQRELGRIQSQIGQLQSQIGRLQSEAGRQQSAIGHQQSELGKKQGELGKQQSELGRQQAEIARQASRELRRMFDDAITKGIAKPE